MNEILTTIRLIVELTQGVEEVVQIIQSEGRDLTPEEVQSLRERVDASTSSWLSALEALRNDD